MKGRRRIGLGAAQSLGGRGRPARATTRIGERSAANPTPRSDSGAIADDRAREFVKGPSPAAVARLDSAVAQVPFRELPMIDRPYLFAALTFAHAGNAEKARAMIARYRAEMTDTSIRRVQEADLHGVLGEIALADGKPRDAIAEFRRSDVGYDGAPANECAPCLPFDLARAYDAAGKPDSAASVLREVSRDAVLGQD